MRITFKAFDSKMASREKLFKAAIEFANKLDRKDLINITHSEDRDNIVITVWYWTDEPDKGADIKAKRDADINRTPESSQGIIGSGGAMGAGRDSSRETHKLPVGESLLGKLNKPLPPDDPTEQAR
jgi:hypothetical protein